MRQKKNLFARRCFSAVLTAFLLLSTVTPAIAASGTVSAENAPDSITLKGDLGTVAMKGTEGTIDLTALCSRGDDGTYLLQISFDRSAPLTVRVMQASVPALFIRSADPDTMGRAFVDKSKENQTTGSAVLLSTDGKTVYDGALSQIKARGNTTFVNAPKKSYQIKLDKKTDLIGIGEKGKTWVLLAGYADATQMHDKLLKDLASTLGMAYTPKDDWVDLYYDGEYRGIYLLGEKNSVGSTGVKITDMEDSYQALNDGYGKNAVLKNGSNRFGMDYQYTEGLAEPENITGGYLLELNNTQYDEASGFHTRQTIDRNGKQEHIALNVKSPEWAGKAAMDYISEYYQEFEDAVYAQDADGHFTGINPETGKRFDAYMDLQSLIQMYLIQELAANVDGFYSSLFFYKDADAILHTGPVWDLDSTFGSGWSGVVGADNTFLSGRYLISALVQIPEFKQAADDYYASVFRAEAVKLPERVAAHSAYIRGSTDMNYKIWPLVRIGNPNKDGHLWPDGTVWDDTLLDLKQWIADRISMMDKTHGYSAGVTVPVTPADTAGEALSLQACEPAETVVPDAAAPLQTSDASDAYVENVSAQAGPEIIQMQTVNDQAYLFLPACADLTALPLTVTAHGNGNTEPTPTAEPEKPCSGDDTCPSKHFGDVDHSPTCWYHPAVDWAITHDPFITDGTSESTFSPAAACTRAQVVTFLWRAENKPKPTITACPFTDVKEGAYYYDAVMWAVEKGITDGTGKTTFSPNEKVTRGQFVTFLARCAGKDTAAAGTPFTDVPASAYYAGPVAWAYQAGITDGKTETTFGPKDTCTRAQVVTFLYRYYNPTEASE